MTTPNLLPPSSVGIETPPVAAAEARAVAPLLVSGIEAVARSRLVTVSADTLLVEVAAHLSSAQIRVAVRGSKLPLHGACRVPDSADVEVVKKVQLENSHAFPEKSTHQNGVQVTILGVGRGQVPPNTHPRGMYDGFFTASLGITESVKEFTCPQYQKIVVRASS